MAHARVHSSAMPWLRPRSSPACTGWHTQFPPFRMTGYLVVMGFGMLKGVFGSVQSNVGPVFALYLVGLGLIGAAVVTGFQELTGDRERPAWQLGVAGALTAVGVLWLLFMLLVLL